MFDRRRSFGLLCATALLVAACGGPGGGAASPGRSPSGSPAGSPGAPPEGSPAGSPQAGLTQVRLQLQWEPQAQFAGYFAADREGYYAEEGLQVEFLRGGADVLPHVVGSDPNGPEFTISWVPKVLEVRAKDQSDLVDIAQVFQRSGTRSVSWASGSGPEPKSQDNITSP